MSLNLGIAEDMYEDGVYRCQDDLPIQDEVYPEVKLADPNILKRKGKSIDTLLA